MFKTYEVTITSKNANSYYKPGIVIYRAESAAEAIKKARAYYNEECNDYGPAPSYKAKIVN